nr:MAG TPA: hypothetical protein [Caudoviricetes sp.]
MLQKNTRDKKLNKRLQAILLLLPLVLTLYAEKSNPSPTASGSKFSIDLTRNYTGLEVQELLDIVVEEAEKSITEAYNAGYKQGVLEYKPDVAYWKTQAEGFETLLKAERRKKWLWSLGGVSIGLAGGVGIGIALQLR